MRSSLFTDSKEENQPNSGLVFGLDLGTTNSVVTAKISDGLPKVLHSHSGETTPSCLLFKSDGTYTIGSMAYDSRQSANAVYSFKRHMGTTDKLYKDFTARDISSMFVKKLLEEVKEVNPEFSNYFSVQVSVPAYFDINQIEDTKLAIEDAGYHVAGVNDEPTAAAILYQQAKRVTEDILVFDLGGGTFDAVLVRNVPGILKDSAEFYKTLDVEVPATESVLEILDVSGDNQLGGDDIDKVAADLYIKEHNLSLTEEQKEELLLVAEKVKKTGMVLKPTFSEHKFFFEFVEKGTKVILDRCFEIMNAMLNRAKVFNVNCVLCGGSTKSGVIREELGKRFSLSTDINPDLAVGIGDSIKYYMHATNSGMSIISRLAKGVGILSSGKVKYLADKGTIIPLHSQFVARNAEPFGKNIDIDLYQGEKFSGEHTHISTLTLRDITGHDEEGYVSIVIDLTITSDGTISVKVASGEALVRSSIVLSQLKESNNPQDLEVHPEAKLYRKFTKSADFYKDPDLYRLVEEYRNSGERTLAKEIMSLLGRLAN